MQSQLKCGIALFQARPYFPCRRHTLVAVATTSPVVRRRRLGLELRALREATGLSGEDVADRTGWSTSKVSRMEIGRNPPSPADLNRLLDLYGVTDQARRDQLAVLLREAKRKGWWQVYSDIPYSTLIGLEAEAVSMLAFASGVVKVGAAGATVSTVHV